MSGFFHLSLPSSFFAAYKQVPGDKTVPDIKETTSEGDKENGNDDENGQQFGGEYNDPIMQDNMQHQENRPKYNSA